MYRTLYSATWALLKLAGVEGFEPPYGGIKNRWPTAWPHPHLESTISETSGVETQPVANLSSNGESFSPLAEKACNPGGNCRTIFCLRSIVSQAKNSAAVAA